MKISQPLLNIGLLTAGILIASTWMRPLYAQDSQKVHIGLVYPISSNGLKAAHTGNTFSFHLISGLSAFEKGFALSGLSTIVKQDEKGVMLSGLTNMVGGTAKGLQIAGLGNIIRGDATGIQLSGIMNTAAQSSGLQLSGLTNMVKKDAQAQISGIANYATGSRLQLSGIANISKDKSSFQAAGLVNIGKHTSTQISGLVNVSKKAKKLQIAGLVNVAEESAYPIALVNIIKNGEMQIGLTIDEVGNTIAELRSGSKKTYGIIGIGGNSFYSNAPYVAEGGIGIHFNLNKSFRINLEAASTVNTNFKKSIYYKSALRANAGIHVSKSIELIAGPTFNYLNYSSKQQEDYNTRFVWEHRGPESINRIYIGAVAGILYKI